MKKLFLGLLIIALPHWMYAQQATVPVPPNDERLKQQVAVMQEELLHRMSMLQDSISELSRQLSQSAAGRDIKDAVQDGWSGFEHELNKMPPLPPLAEIPPVPEMQQAWFKLKSGLQDLHFRFEAPPAPDAPEPEAPPMPPAMEDCPYHK
ncbi:MAG: hypothetical protein K1X61_10850 [Chitinophagales bacterium]|nr:hypothetical protein [Chitinophagales bacterium]